MARNKALQPNIDGSDLTNYPDKRIRNNDGSGNGTPVNEQVYGDIHEFFGKIMREQKINYNGLPDNVTNGYQLYEAFTETPSKNDYIKQIILTAPDTILIPNRVSSLKEFESISYRANFDSSNSIVLIKGTDNSVKNVSILGSWKSGDTVKLVNYSNVVTLVGVYDSQNVPNLAQTLLNIQQTFTNWTKIMSVFQVNGAMLFWNKPANTIPQGWQEVVNWRGRFPVGMSEDEPEFTTLGKEGGEKYHKLTVAEIAKHKHAIGFGKEKVGTGNMNGVSSDKISDNYINYTKEEGGDQPHNNLPPYRTVLFIEYVG